MQAACDCGRIPDIPGNLQKDASFCCAAGMLDQRSLLSWPGGRGGRKGSGNGESGEERRVLESHCSL